MGIEIERKFLVRNDRWRSAARRATELRQGYLANTDACSVRLRVAGERAWLSVKAMQPGPARAEFEYELPVADAEEMLATLAGGSQVRKRRHEVPVGAHCFEVDEFLGENQGLVVAEIELDAVDEAFPRPDWLGAEVTMDTRFHNFRLACEPFRSWSEPRRRATARGESLPGARR